MSDCSWKVVFHASTLGVTYSKPGRSLHRSNSASIDGPTIRVGGNERSWPRRSSSDERRRGYQFTVIEFGASGWPRERGETPTDCDDGFLSRQFLTLRSRPLRIVSLGRLGDRSGILAVDERVRYRRFVVQFGASSTGTKSSKPYSPRVGRNYFRHRCIECETVR